MAPSSLILNDLEGHSPVAGHFKCNPSNICAAFCQTATDSVLARFLSDSWASCLLWPRYEFMMWSWNLTYHIKYLGQRSSNLIWYLMSTHTLGRLLYSVSQNILPPRFCGNFFTTVENFKTKFYTSFVCSHLRYTEFHSIISNSDKIIMPY